MHLYKLRVWVPFLVLQLNLQYSSILYISQHIYIYKIRHIYIIYSETDTLAHIKFNELGVNFRITVQGVAIAHAGSRLV